MPEAQGGERLPDAPGILAGGQHFQDLPHHDPRAFESRLSMANMGISNDIAVDRNLVHSDNSLSQRVGNSKRGTATGITDSPLL